MSHNSGSFFSLNRLFGKKIKHEKTLSTGLSKSTSQTLTRSTTTSEEISPQNKIVPLATIPNAPFEQTFRITVYLPLGQLYVARIGAKTKLSEFLSTICTNKSLDSNKFEFKHPTDDSQAFDLSSTVGEVGLSEIKLVSKTNKDDTAVRYRMHSSYSRENRLIVRPHTISSASPYSSTNSLNSNDSSGIMMNQRMNNSGVPVAPNRKKRVAPRPPSQNSIPENPEKICPNDELQNKRIIADFKVATKRSNLMHQNFHMSSPNLAINNNVMFKSNTIDTNTTIINSFDRRQSENCLNNNKKLLLNRPLSSIQPNKTASDNHSHDFRRHTSENLNSRTIAYHSRTPSDTSVINEFTFPEPQPRSRPPINKKKAPAPPPRTVSTNSTGNPIATPINASSSISNGDIKDNVVEDETHKWIHYSPDLDSASTPTKKPSNVSKVMLNVKEVANELSKTNINNTVICSNNEANSGEEKVCANNSMVEQKMASDEIAFESYNSTAKCKSVSVVNFNLTNGDQTDKMNATDHEAVSLQVNKIIDEAVKINEAKINTEMNGICKAPLQKEHFDQINNDKNNNINDEGGHHEGEENEEGHWDYDQSELITQTSSPNTVAKDLPKILPAEVPIQPVLNETRTFNFQEYSDNSLPTSTTSTLNTAETPSTGPESLITSDIEDGYKGNELEKKRKLETVKRDSKEDFIESQFEFLKEHLDIKTNIDSDEEKTMDFSKRDIISSTMITKEPEVARKCQPVEKADVINELTQIISCNRLDTFIKPNTESKDSVAASKRSSLKNFQISAYSNGNLEISKSKPISYGTSSNQQRFGPEEFCEQANTQPVIGKNALPNMIENKNGNAKLDETFIIAKQINRSVSFYSTSANIMNNEMTIANTGTGPSLYTTSRSNSFLSLNESPKYEQNTDKTAKEYSIGSKQQRSSSELSIADAPSLQSIKVMKSILNSSMKIDRNSQDIKNDEKPSVAHEGDKGKGDQTRSGTHEPDTTNQTKEWIYQGPPSINFSTWGERPKSTVNIKSDEDYIFGGSSKIAALQKRFSGVETEIRKDVRLTDDLKIKQSTGQCDDGKLPIVRSVEYKKNMLKINNNAAPVDTPDSTQPLVSFRPNYEVSHIVSENSFSKNGSSPLKDYSNNNVDPDAKLMNSPQNINATTGVMPRGQSFNILNKTKSVNQFKVAKDTETKELEKPIFTQFMLRKTGLKEKMFDKCGKDDAKHTSGPEAKTNSKPIPTAPEPPRLAKPKIRPVSMNIHTDTRGQLLDSIRNFKRDTLKTNI